MMSSIDGPPSSLHAPPSEAEDVDHSEDCTEQSTRTVYSCDLSTETVFDDNFLDNHLRSPPSFSYTADMLSDVENIKDSMAEDEMYRPTAALLTSVSKTLYDSLDSDKKESLRKLHKVPPRKPGHMSFIDHHTTPPTHFPKSISCSVEDDPDIIGVYNVNDPDHSNDIYTNIPHHRIEAIVNVRSTSNATTCAYQHHQARPDHPTIYCLVVDPEWYQVLLSDPNGVVASPETKWSDPRLLAAYVYSHYYPPDDHFLHDETITWTTSVEGDGAPVWSIMTNGKEYTNCELVFVGDGWGRRTTVFIGTEKNSKTLDKYAIKESYRHYGRRYKEEEVLMHIHAAGDVPGVVRLRSSEHVVSGGKRVECGSEEEKTLRTKERFVFLDLGCQLLEAESVNDLLKAIYDAIEVHRVLCFDRKVLHRDMSINNILMYPKWAKVEGRPMMKNPPPFITDVLTQQPRPDSERIPCCLVIDVDNAAFTEAEKNVASDELTARTGTPMYIARSVCLGSILISPESLDGVCMPTLSGEARDLYISAHGQDRYEKYLDKAGFFHGCTLPTSDYRTIRDLWEEDKGNIKFGSDDHDGSRTSEPLKFPKFAHRPEHDVESVYWTMVSTLLRVQPVSAPKEDFAPKILASTWDFLHKNRISSNPSVMDDLRRNIIDMGPLEWVECFCPEMRDVARLLFKITLQVACEYALWQGDIIEDHLHEAVQRLIPQYLVDHRGNPIPLDPHHLRPTQGLSARLRNEVKPTWQGLSPVTASGLGAVSQPKHGTGRMSQHAGVTRRERGSGAVMMTGIHQSNSKPSAAADPSTSSQIQTPHRKRKFESGTQSGRSSKRRKGVPGLAVPTTIPASCEL